MERAVGQRHPHPWPKIIGFHTQGAVDKVLRHMRDDRIWNVTEKLDGSNLTISTEGWIASRNLIKLNLFENVDFELTLYGELILNGAGNRRNDDYNYRIRDINPGDYYCFGIGLILPENVGLPSVFSKGIHTSSEEGKQYFIVPINPYLATEFTNFGIEHVNIIMSEKLSSILDDVELSHNTRNKELEGYVLSEETGEAMIKYKSIPGILPNTKHIEKIVKVIKNLTVSSLNPL